MSFARARLILAALLFFGWLSWLGYAVSKNGKVPVVSRAQLTAATHLVVAEVKAGGDGLPEPSARVVEVIRIPTPIGTVPTTTPVAVDSKIYITNLQEAQTPDATGFPGPGLYFMALTKDDHDTFRIAGMPRSPGYEAQEPTRKNGPGPIVYPWSDAFKAQLRGLGVVK